MIIYKTTNTINGKIYVGKDSNNEPKYLGSGKLLKKAITKYGKCNFTKEILQYCNSVQELNEAEQHWIEVLYARNLDIGYNIALGGDGQRYGTTVTKETKSKMSFSNTLEGYIARLGEDEGLKRYNKRNELHSATASKRFENPEERNKYSRPGELNGMYGKKHSTETIEKMRNKQIGKKSSPETKQKLSDMRKGEKNSNYGNGHLFVGHLNGMAKKWKLISPDQEEFLLNGNVQVFSTERALSSELLYRFKNTIVPLNLKMRKSKDLIQYKLRLNTLGWSLIEFND